ncbi:DgyrCDS12441 [Dimorphilus gyrociliatus]|uniref:DgyrCDS12441 n=1 Tax=Dimorphilus gyrociliatus TaxID=2664684 RepID=A0A7I8W6G6_9ANNE|nr:DgyrCDS12441 [Dimorphilus gyrociliatus]
MLRQQLIDDRDFQVCRVISQVCCIKNWRKFQCSEGKGIAYSGRACPKSFSKPELYESKKCCKCCQLGLLAKETLRLSCSQMQSKVPHCGSVFYECCSGREEPGMGSSPAQCPANCRQKCDQRSGKPICGCYKGYKLNKDKATCNDVDECAKNPCKSFERCLNTVGSYKCEKIPTTTGKTTKITTTLKTTTARPSCGAGYFYDDTEKDCLDIDECKQSDLHNCHGAYQRCWNTPGSFICNCPSGFKYHSKSGDCVDINECEAPHLNGCKAGMRCENNVGSYKCRRAAGCGSGYTLDEISQECFDINECEVGTHGCMIWQNCINLLGSNSCIRKNCTVGYRLNYKTGECSLIPCNPGYSALKTGRCEDINECKASKNPCSEGEEECINTPGSFVCKIIRTCPKGFILDNSITELDCVDLNECAINGSICEDSKMKCLNTYGSYICECPRGYAKSGSSCEDINECLEERRYSGRICPENSDCINTKGSYYCECRIGFAKKNDMCQDVDECQIGGNDCEQLCFNRFGSYGCSCRKGYRLGTDRKSCIDYDECKTGPYPCYGLCKNKAGSFECSCPSGYKLDWSGRICKDIDECQSRNACRYNQLCVNKKGSHTCVSKVCPRGYSKKLAYGRISCINRARTFCNNRGGKCKRKPWKVEYHYSSFAAEHSAVQDVFSIKGPFIKRISIKFEFGVEYCHLKNGTKLDLASYFRLYVHPNRSHEAILKTTRQLPSNSEISIKVLMHKYSKQRGQVDRYVSMAEHHLIMFVTKLPWPVSRVNRRRRRYYALH